MAGAEPFAWKRRTGGRQIAHLFVRGVVACIGGSLPGSPFVEVVDAGVQPSGLPYGRVCANCTEEWTRRAASTV